MNKLGYNPDVLSCLANLSNDEVFTPPQLANQMLDMLPQELFRSPDTKFLDPCAKSGVFLREIAKRLINGLADRIPDLQERIDHILHHQLYGIAITTAPRMPTASTASRISTTPTDTSVTGTCATRGKAASAPTAEPAKKSMTAPATSSHTPMSSSTQIIQKNFSRI